MQDRAQRQRQQRRRARRQQITGVQVVFVSILAIGLLLTINFSARIRRGQVYNDLKVQVEGTIDALQQENVELRKQFDFVQSESAVAQWAHRDGKMVRPGEVLVIPYPSFVQSTPVAQPTAIPPPREPDREEQVPIWQLWWSLFFDGDPP